MDIVDEFKIKMDRMNKYMEKKGLDGVVLTRTDNFAWATCGGCSHVNIAADQGAATFMLLDGKAIVMTDNIEKQRLLEEELDGLPVEFYVAPWQVDVLNLGIANYTKDKLVKTDAIFGSLTLLDSDFTEMTMIMEETEMVRFRSTGARTGRSIEEACMKIEKGMTEYQVAGLVAERCYSRGVTPIVILVAADERGSSYRHPLPGDRKIDKTAMVVVCGRRKGLIASCTRMVSLGEPSEELMEKHAACVFVDVVMNMNTHPGRKVSEIFEAAQEAYANAGFPDEWQNHHQGGPTGYRTRYYKATGKTDSVVLPNTAYAWNPSIAGTKSEDTVLVGNNRNEFVTQGPDWPAIELEAGDVTVQRPDILVL